MANPQLRRWNSLFLFPILVVALVFTEWWITTIPNFATAPDILPLAITTDLLVGIPLLGYWFLVRPKRAPATILAPLFLLAVVVANLILPESGKRYLNFVELALPLLELALFLYALSKVRHIIRAYRNIRPTTVYPADAIRLALRDVMGDSPAIEIVLTELSLMVYGIGGWFMQYRPTQSTHRAFTYYRKSGYTAFFGLLVGMTLIEIPLIHIVVNHFNPVAAWVLTGLSLYSLFWLTGDFHAIRLHPIVVDDTHLHLRAGMRWRVSLPLTEIRSIHKMSRAEQRSKGHLSLAVIGEAKWLIETTQPVTVMGLFGMKRVTDKVGIVVDDEVEFLEMLKGRGVGIV